MSYARAVLLGLALITPAPMTLGQSSATYRIERGSIDGGAGRASSASHGLVGTVGQPDAGAPQVSASYALQGGFHRAVPTSLPDELFRDGFE
jgi:hypothetical protein